MALTKDQKRRWLEIIRLLKKELPTEIYLTVRTKKLKRTDGHIHHYNDGKNQHYEISICSTLSFSSRVDTLEHEYAHALDRFERWGGDEKKAHGPSWGKELARCHRIVREHEGVE